MSSKELYYQLDNKRHKPPTILDQMISIIKLDINKYNFMKKFSINVEDDIWTFSTRLRHGLLAPL